MKFSDSLACCSCFSIPSSPTSDMSPTVSPILTPAKGMKPADDAFLMKAPKKKRLYSYEWLTNQVSPPSPFRLDSDKIGGTTEGEEEKCNVPNTPRPVSIETLIGIYPASVLDQNNIDGSSLMSTSVEVEYAPSFDIGRYTAPCPSSSDIVSGKYICPPAFCIPECDLNK